MVEEDNEDEGEKVVMRCIHGICIGVWIDLVL